jgi:uncharacterized protein
MRNEFVGRGWGFPLRADANGSIALVSDEREIEEAIRLVLATSPGERPMRPEFGCRIHEHVFAPVSAGTAGLLAFEVRQSLEQWEPRISVDDVVVSYDAQDRSVVYIDISYRINDTNSTRNLVFPFYTIPAE